MVFSSKSPRRRLAILLGSILSLATWVFSFQAVFTVPRSSSLQQRMSFRGKEESSSSSRALFSSRNENNKDSSPPPPPPTTTLTRIPVEPQSDQQTSSWVPRLAFLFVNQFRHRLEKVNATRVSAIASSVKEEESNARNGILEGSNGSIMFVQDTSTGPSFNTTASTFVSFSAAMAVVDGILDVPQDELPDIGPIIDQLLTSEDGDDDDDDEQDLSARASFFPLPTTTSTRSVNPDSNAGIHNQVMWNLTRDLSDEEERGEELLIDTSVLKEPEIFSEVQSDEKLVDGGIGTNTVSSTNIAEELLMVDTPTTIESASSTEKSPGFDIAMDEVSEESSLTKPLEAGGATDEATMKSRFLNSDAVPMEVYPEVKDFVPSDRLDFLEETAVMTVETELDTLVVFEESDHSSVANNMSPGKDEDSEQENLKRRAAEISHSFYAKEFRPTGFAKNPHLQTIVAVKARQESMYFPTTGNLILSKFQWDYRQRVETPDGDFFDVDWKYASTQATATDDFLLATNDPSTVSSTTPIVLICHGLQSNTDSPLTKDMTIAFKNVGMDVAAINFRGCSGEPNRTPMGYHLSYTDDLELMVKQISTNHPGRPIYLSGFSLGANVVTNFLANIGANAANAYNIWGAAVNAVPFDLTKCQSVNEPGFSGSVYGNLLFKSLQTRVLQSMETIDYNFTREELENCTNCQEFDDLVVCSVYDEFENATDYHRKSSTYNRLHEIMVPQLIVQALDDPFFVGNTNPDNDPTLPCRIHYTKHGGHCGYVFHSEERDKRDSSFMPTELARFLEHVHQARTGQKSTTLALRQKQPMPIKPQAIENTKGQVFPREKLRRAMAATAAHAFVTREFVPAEWAKNEHVQTIMGALFRRQTMYVNNRTDTMSLLQAFFSTDEFKWDERERISTPDGDFFDVDWKYVNSNAEDRPLVLICHGLQSDSSSPLAQDMAQAFNDIGMDAGCVNFRGCSGEINKTPVGYHLGFTEDLLQIIDRVNKKYPHRRIYLSGFSLGANVVTHCLTELGERAYDHNIYGAAVNAVPFDMPKAQLNLNQDGLTKSLYGGRLLASMIDRVEASYDRMEFQFPKEEARKCRTIMDMENLVIAPIFGFKDAYDYYAETSTLRKVDQVAVPQLVIQAKDDPFFAGQSVPEEDANRPLRVQMTNNGGHCGYVFHAKLEDSNRTSWMPTELARFLAHLEETFSSSEVVES